MAFFEITRTDYLHNQSTAHHLKSQPSRVAALNKKVLKYISELISAGVIKKRNELIAIAATSMKEKNSLNHSRSETRVIASISVERIVLTVENDNSLSFSFAWFHPSRWDFPPIQLSIHLSKGFWRQNVSGVPCRLITTTTLLFHATELYGNVCKCPHEPNEQGKPIFEHYKTPFDYTKVLFLCFMIR